MLFISRSYDPTSLPPISLVIWNALDVKDFENLVYRFLNQVEVLFQTQKSIKKVEQLTQQNLPTLALIGLLSVEDICLIRNCKFLNDPDPMKDVLISLKAYANDSNLALNNGRRLASIKVQALRLYNRIIKFQNAHYFHVSVKMF